MREEHPSTRNPWDYIKIPDDSNGWLWLGLTGLTIGAIGFGIYYNWDSIHYYIPPYFPTSNSFNDIITSIKSFGSSSYVFVYSIVESLWRGTPGSNNIGMSHEEAAPRLRGLDDLRDRLRRWDDEEIQLHDNRTGGSDSSTPTRPLTQQEIREINPFDAGTPSTSAPLRPNLTINTNPQRPGIASSVWSSNPDPFNLHPDPNPEAGENSSTSAPGSFNPWGTPQSANRSNRGLFGLGDISNPRLYNRPGTGIWGPLPVEPFGSVAPTEPIVPTEPVAPVAPTEPVAPVAPTEPGTSTNTTNPASTSNTTLGGVTPKFYRGANFLDKEYINGFRRIKVRNLKGGAQEFLQSESGDIVEKYNYNTLSKEKQIEILSLINNS